MDNIEIPVTGFCVVCCCSRILNGVNWCVKEKGENMARQSYLEHSAVTVRDIEWSQKFFEKILGMTETRRKEKDGHLKMVWLKGGVQLVAAPEDYKAGQGHHLGIVVEDMPEVLREMLAVKGVHHIEGKPEKWVQLPDGLTLELFHEKPGAIQNVLNIEVK